MNIRSTFSDCSQSLLCSFMELVTFYLDWLYQSDCFQMLICRAQGVPRHDSGSHSAGAGVTKSAAIHIFGLLLQPEELHFCLFYLVEFCVRLLLLKIWKSLLSLLLLYFLLRPLAVRIYLWFIFSSSHYLAQCVAIVDTQIFLVGAMKELSLRDYGLVQFHSIDSTV